MHEADFFLEIHSRSVLSNHSISFFHEAVSPYPFQNGKSLIAILSHKNTVHIATTKGFFEK
jgi:hypothetical protein